MGGCISKNTKKIISKEEFWHWCNLCRTISCSPCEWCQGTLCNGGGCEECDEINEAAIAEIDKILEKDGRPSYIPETLISLYLMNLSEMHLKEAMYLLEKGTDRRRYAHNVLKSGLSDIGLCIENLKKECGVSSHDIFDPEE